MLPYLLKTIQNEDEFFKIVEKLKPEQVVVDNYAFTLEHQQEFKELFPNIKLSCFDDEYKEYRCDEIINHNLGVNLQHYKNPNIVTSISPLIRREFQEAKKKTYKKEGLFISLGGSDSTNLTLEILKVLKREKINLYTTTANRNLKNIRRYVKLHKNIKLHINEEIAEGMAKSRFGVITASTIAYEALFMKLAFIALQTAKNQENLLKYLKKNRYITLQRGIDGRNIKNSILRSFRRLKREHCRYTAV